MKQLKQLKYAGSEFEDIRQAVDEAEQLAAIGDQTSRMLLKAACAAVKQPNTALRDNVFFIIQNRLAGASLLLENPAAQDYIESFRE